MQKRFLSGFLLPFAFRLHIFTFLENFTVCEKKNINLIKYQLKIYCLYLLIKHKTQNSCKRRADRKNENKIKYKSKSMSENQQTTTTTTTATALSQRRRRPVDWKGTNQSWMNFQNGSYLKLDAFLDGFQRTHKEQKAIVRVGKYVWEWECEWELEKIYVWEWECEWECVRVARVDAKTKPAVKDVIRQPPSSSQPQLAAIEGRRIKWHREAMFVCHSQIAAHADGRSEQGGWLRGG